MSTWTIPTMRGHTEDNDPAGNFEHWITERHAIYLRKTACVPGPLTQDPILARYRFCNVYRQLDRVTVWLNEHWFPSVPIDLLPFWACVARLLNCPEPLDAVRPARWSTFNSDTFIRALEVVKSRGGTVRGPAYIVSTNGHALPLPEYLARHVLSTLWEQRRGLLAPSPTLKGYHAKLTTVNGFGSFMAGQVIADLKYWHPAFKGASDWSEFVVPGPGSKRGLNRLLGKPHDAPMSDKMFAAEFDYPLELARSTCVVAGYPEPHAQDVQNCLCEFDKYERARLGQGRPKSLYMPS